MRWYSRSLMAGLAVAVGVGCHDSSAPATAPKPPTEALVNYTPVLLAAPAGQPFSGAYAINDSGDIVGFAYPDSAIHSRPFIWHRGTPSQIPVTRIAPAGEARSINNLGVIAGWIGLNAPRAVYWPSARSQPQTLGVLGTSSWANDVNLTGTIVGGYAVSGGSGPFVWDATNLIRSLPVPAGTTAGEARSINDRGSIVGWVSGNSCPVAIEWNPIGRGAYRYILLVAANQCSQADDISPQGTAVGTAFDAAGSKYNGVRFVPGSAPVFLAGEFFNAEARGISGTGRVVGRLAISADTAWTIDPIGGSAYMLRNGGLQAPIAGAFGINFCGQIVGLSFEQTFGFPASPQFVHPHAVMWDGQNVDCR